MCYVDFPTDFDVIHETLDGFSDHPMANLLAELPKTLSFLDSNLEI